MSFSPFAFHIHFPTSAALATNATTTPYNAFTTTTTTTTTITIGTISGTNSKSDCPSFSILMRVKLVQPTVINCLTMFPARIIAPVKREIDSHLITPHVKMSTNVRMTTTVQATSGV